MQSTSLGFEPEGLLTVRIELPYTKYNDLNKTLSFTNGLLGEVRQLPGVQTAALSSNPPMLSGWQLNFQPEGAPPTDPSQQPSADNEVVQGDYFAAMKINLIRGRTFTEARQSQFSPRDHHRPDAGRHDFQGAGPHREKDHGRHGRGFVERSDAPRDCWRRSPPEIPRLRRRHAGAVVFLSADASRPHQPHCPSRPRIGEREATRKSVRDIITRLDPAQPVFDVRTMEERVAETWATHRLLTFLLAIFAGLALLLAAVGLYGVLAYTALRRVREIAVRLAARCAPGAHPGAGVGPGSSPLWRRHRGWRVRDRCVRWCDPQLSFWRQSAQSPQTYLAVRSDPFIVTSWPRGFRAPGVPGVRSVALRAEMKTRSSIWERTRPRVLAMAPSPSRTLTSAVGKIVSAWAKPARGRVRSRQSAEVLNNYEHAALWN